MKTIKIITLLVFIVLTNALSAQDKFNGQKIDFKSVRSINIDSGDTTRYISISFRNMEYDHIIDIGLVIISNNYDKEILISDLEKIAPYVKSKTEAKSVRDSYALIVSNGIYKGVYLFDKKNKYTVIRESEISNIVEWLKTVEL